MSPLLISVHFNRPVSTSCQSAFGSNRILFSVFNNVRFAPQLETYSCVLRVPESRRTFGQLIDVFFNEMPLGPAMTVRRDEVWFGRRKSSPVSIFGPTSKEAHDPSEFRLSAQRPHSLFLTAVQLGPFEVVRVWKAAQNTRPLEVIRRSIQAHRYSDVLLERISCPYLRTCARSCSVL